MIDGIDKTRKQRLSNGPIEGINSIIEKSILMVMAVQISLDLEINVFM